MNRFFRIITHNGAPWVITPLLIALGGGDASLPRDLLTLGWRSMMAIAWLAWIADLGYLFFVQRQESRILTEYTLRLGKAPLDKAEEWVVLEGWYERHWAHKWRRLLLDRCLKPSIVEELFYRAPFLALMPVFKERVYGFVVIFGVLFGLGHAFNFDKSQTILPEGTIKTLRASRRSRMIVRNVAIMSVFGIFMGYVTVSVQCLWVAIAIHFCYNFQVFLRVYFALRKTKCPSTVARRPRDECVMPIRDECVMPLQDECTTIPRPTRRRRRDRRRWRKS